MVHEEYKPTVEEAITAVRNFFNGWEDGTEQEDIVCDDDTIKSPKISYAEKAREIERRSPPGSAPGVWGHIVSLANSEKANERADSIIFAFDELRVTVCALYNIHPDGIHDPQDNLSLALNDVCMLCDLRPLIFMEGIALVETDQAIVLWANE